MPSALGGARYLHYSRWHVAAMPVLGPRVKFYGQGAGAGPNLSVRLVLLLVCVTAGISLLTIFLSCTALIG